MIIIFLYKSEYHKMKPYDLVYIIFMFPIDRAVNINIWGVKKEARNLSKMI